MGSGVGHFEKMAVFVEGAVIGDKLSVHIIKVKSSYAVGIINKIIKPSKHRIPSDCVVSEKCGGCSYRHISYSHELEIKKQGVQDALQRIGGLDVEVEEILSIEKINNYRNKGQYPVGMNSLGQTLIGFYAKRSHRIVDCRNCALAPAEFEAILKTVERWSAIAGVSIYSDENKKGILRHIYLRKAFATKETMVCLVINSETVAKKELLTKMLLEADETIVSVILNINKKDTNVILGEECETVFGKDYIEDILCGLKFRISPLSFYQVNPAGTQLLYSRAKQYAEIDKTKTVLDLYCGAGTIGLSMADSAKEIIGVEIIPQAVENAKENARLNNIENARFFCDDASGAAKRFACEGLKPDVIILDPPRKGCSGDVIDAVVEMNPERVVYVSCDSATLARDCKIFASKGYKTVNATAVDMFPRTTHCETVVLLSQRRPDAHIDIKLDLSEVDVTAAETKATYQEIKDYVLEKHGLKVSTLYISQVKAKCGIIERECYNKGEGKSRVPQCPKEKEEAIMDALRHFRMV
ncbi:MAG: 23S rRNA (uracil(1939)-C(5))-methyltransferase RlmD [Clostridia bacterium]|nr:23S rRNA (uracil(1939)-C(5))-methyltransferase RlmD [Clostridia bacterium]